jgi:predicted flap endonuclease-1-like 5' DNA nuclease
VSPLIAFVILVAALVLGYLVGRGSRKIDAGASDAAAPVVSATAAPAPSVAVTAAPTAASAAEAECGLAEHARIIRSYEGEAAQLRRAIAARDALHAQEAEFAAERRRLFDQLAQSRTETARYRQLVIDLEDNAPSTLFGPGAPDDLRLIVGIGPVLERMLHQLGVTTFRQVAFWSERDIDEFDARLHEFPGRIRRDEWVTQARSLHQSKYGEPPVRP